MMDEREGDRNGGRERGRKKGGNDASGLRWAGGMSGGKVLLTAHTLSSTIRFEYSVTFDTQVQYRTETSTYLPTGMFSDQLSS